MIARTLSFGTPGKLTVHDEQLVWDGENDGRHMPVAQMQPFAAYTTDNETVAGLRDTIASAGNYADPRW